MTPAKHPGFLSFGSVSLYTLISPSSPYFIFDLVLRSRLAGASSIFKKSIQEVIISISFIIWFTLALFIKMGSIMVVWMKN